MNERGKRKVDYREGAPFLLCFFACMFFGLTLGVNLINKRKIFVSFFEVENNKRSTKRGYGLLGKVNEIIEGRFLTVEHI